MTSFRHDPDCEANQLANRENQRTVFAAKMMAEPVIPAPGISAEDRANGWLPTVPDCQFMANPKWIEKLLKLQEASGRKPVTGETTP